MEKKTLKLANGAEAYFVTYITPIPAVPDARIVNFRMWVRARPQGLWNVAGSITVTGNPQYASLNGPAAQAMKACIQSFTY